jgi:hypothetical protein
MVLLTMLDDAANHRLAGFCEGETVEAYFDLDGRLLAKYTRLLTPYTDHESLFGSTSNGEKT